MEMTSSSLYPLKSKKIWVAGHRGMAGSAIVKRLASEQCQILCSSREELDLTRQADVENWLTENKPDAIFLAAARVGGIHANSEYPGSFIYDNLAIEINIVEAARKANVERLLFLGSSCIYPRECHQPIKEEYLLTGPLEMTNEWYAIAKIAGIKLCQSYRRQYGCDYFSVMPTNLYGPGDNFHPENSHVPAALLRRFHEAKEENIPEVEIWGTGSPRREFLHVDDLANACVFLMKNYSDEALVNIGYGADISIKEFAETIKRVTGYTGKLVYDTSKPDGTPRKLLDSSRLRELGWSPEINIETGLKMYYDWFLENQSDLRSV